MAVANPSQIASTALWHVGANATTFIISIKVEGVFIKMPGRAGVPQRCQRGNICQLMIGFGLNVYIHCKFMDKVITFYKFVD